MFFLYAVGCGGYKERCKEVVCAMLGSSSICVDRMGIILKIKQLFEF